MADARGLTQAMLPTTILLTALAIALTGSEEPAVDLGSAVGATRSEPAPSGARDPKLSPFAVKGSNVPG